MIAAIVARSKNGVIGNNGKIPWNLPDDFRYFRRITTGHAVIMGRKTADSIIAHLGHGLPDRTNIVITRDNDYHPDGFVVAHSIEDALRIGGSDAFVIGGEQIYRLAMPFLQRLYITEVDVCVDGDAYFPEFSALEWKKVSSSKHSQDENHLYDFSFDVYDAH